LILAGGPGFSRGDAYQTKPSTTRDEPEGRNAGTEAAAASRETTLAAGAKALGSNRTKPALGRARTAGVEPARPDARGLWAPGTSVTGPTHATPFNVDGEPRASLGGDGDVAGKAAAAGALCAAAKRAAPAASATRPTGLALPDAGEAPGTQRQPRFTKVIWTPHGNAAATPGARKGPQESAVPAPATGHAPQ
jgi:hypothetical protein